MKRFLMILLLIKGIQGFSQQAIHFTTISTEGPPLIFLPHIGCSSAMWQNIADHYKASYSIHMADLAGFNGQAPVDSPFTSAYVQGLRQFIVSKGLKNVMLVGQNYGAFIAMQAGLDTSLSIRAIIASDFYPNLGMVLDPHITTDQLEAVKKGIFASYMAGSDSAFAANQRTSATMMNFSDTGMANVFVRWQLNSHRPTLAGTLCEQLGTNLLPALSNNRIPILAYTTWYFASKYKQMPLTAANAKLREMYGNTPLVTHAITEQAKDFMANEQPAWFIEEMDRFIKLLTIEK